MREPISNCICCDAEDFSERFPLREMMFGFRDQFPYHQCRKCGTVQCCFDLGAEMARYYPSDYYSFGEPQKASKLRRALLRVRTAAMLNSVLRPIVFRFLPEDEAIRDFLSWGGKKNDKILDVGCGTGRLLFSLENKGLKNLMGVDPYISESIQAGGVTVYKAEVTSIEGSFDLIMFNHSLEHILNARDALSHAATLLSDDGRCVVRLPTVSSEAFESFGRNWVQLDPPRHCFIPSRDGMKILGERSGLRLVETIDDGKGWSYFSSEQYEKDIALNVQIRPVGLAMKQYEVKAEKANRASRGDQAAFLFMKV